MAEITKIITPDARVANMVAKITSLAEEHGKPTLLDQGIRELIYARVGMHKEAGDLPEYNYFKKTLMALVLDAVMNTKEDKPLSIRQTSQRLNRSYRAVWLELHEIERRRKEEKTETLEGASGYGLIPHRGGACTQT